MNERPTRRSFVSFAASLLGVALTRPGPLLAATPSMPPAPRSWDIAWLDGLKGKHRQVFSVGQLPGHLPMHVVTNWLDAHREVFGLESPDVNAVVGIAGSFPVNAADALWDKYELGRRWELKDPQTGEWAKRNIYLAHMPAGGKEVGIQRLKERGAIFWQCNNALNAVAHSLADDTKRTFEQVRAELLAGLLPGVKLVPAHTFMLGLAQERGFSYEQIG